MTIATIGLDLAKSVFQAHGVDESGATVLVKRLHRKQMLPFFSKLPPCLIGVEACGTAHFWARTLVETGHEVRLIPPSYVKAYVICPPLSGPETMIVWTTKGMMNAKQEAQAGRDYRQAA